VAYAIAVTLLIYPSYAIAFWLIDMKFRQYAKQFWTIAVATLGMAAVITGLRFLFDRIIGMGDLPILVILITVGAACYIGLLMLVDRDLLTDLLEIIRDLKVGTPPPETQA